MVRVFLVASTPALRHSVRALIEGDGVQVIGESNAFGTGLASDAGVVISVGWPLAEDAAFSDPRRPALLVLSDEQPSAERVAALAADGWGVLPRGVSGETLRAAIAAVATGLAVMPPSMARRRLAAGAGASGGDEGPLDESLTEREREVLELAAQGLANKQIARRLGISDHTVKFHLSTIYGKLGVSSRTEAIGRGLRRGLITL